MKPLRGMTLVDTLVGTALVLIVFLALMGLLRTSLLIASSAKAKAGATAVATTQMEYLRSLSYDSVGTVGGIPAGPVPQYATTTLNNVPYGVRTLVQYVDDPKDGSGSADTNSITTDYKRARVATTYQFRGETREVVLVSNIVPPSIETTAGGGTLRVNVVNATGAAVAGASVRVQNSTLTPSVDVTTFTDIAGTVFLPGAPTSTQYRISVSKDGYSTAETYARDATNQNPTPGYLTVAQHQTTSSTFAIDQLATFTLRTLAPIRATTTVDTFQNASMLAEQVSTQVSGGALTLSGVPGSYAASGSARTTATPSAYVHAWTSLAASVSVPVGTTLALFVTDVTGALLPDSVLPGNSTGFTAFPVSLSTVATTTYPTLALRAQLATPDGVATPELLDWTISYEEGPVPIPNVPFTLIGTKKKGTTGTGVPIYKTSIATTTDSLGTRSLVLEWDAYTIAFNGYSLIAPTTTVYTLDPGITVTAEHVIE